MIQKQPSCNDPFETGMIPVAAAVEQILSHTRSLDGFCQLPLRDCLGRVLYQSVKSPINVPAHDNSAMDGFAMRSEDIPAQGEASLIPVGSALAGRPFEGACNKGECVRVMTGAIVPQGTDTVVIQEDIEQHEDGSVLIDHHNRQHQNIRFAGEDIKQDAVVLEAGHRISAADLGVLASLGVAELKVTRKPRVSFFSTGDELKSIGQSLNKGEIYDSNRYSLFGLLSQCHVDIIDMGVVRDDPQELQAALRQAAQHSDVILTSGGVSVGEADFIKPVLQSIGAMQFWKIAMKPGRPLTFGHIDDALLFGLPGNPVAVMVTFYQFVLPCLKKLSGQKYQPPRRFAARCESAIRKKPGRREYQRAVAQNDAYGHLSVRLTGRQGSGILTSMKIANCFLVLDEESGAVEAGDEVMVEFFHDYF